MAMMSTKEASELARRLSGTDISRLSGPGNTHASYKYEHQVISGGGGKKKKWGPPICFVIAIDVSGSMNTTTNGVTRLEAAKNGLKDLLKGLKKRGHNGDFVHVMVYDKLQYVLTPWCMVKKLDIDRCVDPIKIGKNCGYDTMYDTIFKMIEDCQKRFKKKKHKGNTELFLLSDGQDCASKHTLEEVCAKVKKPGLPNLWITLLGVDLPADGQAAMNKIAASSKSVKTMSVNSKNKMAGSIRKAFTTELGNVISRTRVVIEVTRTSGGSRKHSSSKKPPPKGYVCHNCGISGHWKQNCTK